MILYGNFIKGYYLDLLTLRIYTQTLEMQTTGQQPQTQAPEHSLAGMGRHLAALIPSKQSVYLTAVASGQF